MMHYYGYGHGPEFGFGLFGFILSILFWVLIISLIISLFQRNHDSDEIIPTKKHNEQNSYLDIVKRRYAEGEINKKEYEQLKRDLE